MFLKKKFMRLGLMKKIYKILKDNGYIYYGVLEKPKGKDTI